MFKHLNTRIPKRIDKKGQGICRSDPSDQEK